MYSLLHKHTFYLHVELELYIFMGRLLHDNVLSAAIATGDSYTARGHTCTQIFGTHLYVCMAMHVSMNSYL